MVYHVKFFIEIGLAVYQLVYKGCILFSAQRDLARSEGSFIKQDVLN